MGAEAEEAGNNDRYWEGVFDGVIGFVAFGLIIGGGGLAFAMAGIPVLGLRGLLGFVGGFVLAILGAAWFGLKLQQVQAFQAAELAAQIAEINRRDEAGEPQQWDLDRLEFLRAHFPKEAAEMAAELRERQRIASLKRR